MEEFENQLPAAKRSFSVIGFAFSALIVVASLAQIALLLLPKLLGWEDTLEQSSWWMWVSTSVPMYLFGFPACMLVLQLRPGKAPETHGLSVKQFFTLLPICFFLMYAGNLVGSGLSYLLSGGNAVNSLESYTMDNHPLKIVVIVILAPVLEEYFCRKMLIDRTAQYGEKLSVLMSGLVFGLLHGNFFQFFYAFALGSLFAYVYLRTGRIRYTMIFHAIINFLGAVVAPVVASLLEGVTADIDSTESSLQAAASALSKALLVAGYSMTLLGLSILGLVLLILKRHDLIWKQTEQQLSGKLAWKAAILNVGMILYILICLAMIVLALFNN